MIKKFASAFITAALCIGTTACSITVTEDDNNAAAQTVQTDPTSAAVTEETDFEAHGETDKTEESAAEETVSSDDNEKLFISEQTTSQASTSTSAATSDSASSETDISSVTTEASTTATLPAAEWTETAANGTMYVNTDGIYSRIKAVQGSTKVSRYSLNQAVSVTAKTNTNYYKLDNGEFIHADYLSTSKTVITTSAPVSTTTAATSATTTAAPATPTTTTTTAPPVTSVQEILTPEEFIQRVFELTNQERTKAGKQPFECMDTLDDIAAVRADELTQSFSHTRPDGRGFSTAFNDKGIIYGSFGENIAAGQSTPEAVVEAWMNSEGHRANILSDVYTYMGVGYVFDKGNYQNMDHFWVQNFYSY